jgi:alpha-amylase
MAGTNNTVTTGYAGSSFSPTGYGYPAVPYANADFHHPGSGCPTSGSISDWNNEEQVTECELLSLSDLYTEKDEVRTKIAGFLNDLVGLGVDGFRVDAVKHIKKADFAAILGKVNNTVAENKRPYVAQEIFDGASNDALKAAAFTGNGDVLDFAYAKTIKSQFQGSISNFANFSSWTMDAPSDKVFAMVVNHDLERDGVVLSYKNGDDYTLANYFALAWPHGRPSVYDSFTWSNRDQSPPANDSGYVTDANCANGAWTCNAQTTAMKGMVGWHNAVAATKAVSNFTATNNNVIGFNRGSLGWVGINDSAVASTATYTTGLADGAYCDVITGGVTASACAGTTVTVAAGKATVTIPANNAVAIHVDAKPGTVSDDETTTEVTFKETATTVWGTNVYLVGDIAGLGSWNPANAIALSSAGYPVWSVKLTLPKSKSFEYKYIKKDADGTVTWESGSNRSYSTGTSSSYILNDTWK